MHIWTHKLLADLLYEGVSKVYPGVLSRRAFLNGNLLPDLDSRYQQFQHYTHGSWTYLERLMGEMEDLSCSSESGSEKLGIICHFIADFFCKVHNRPYSEQHSLLGHVMYEHQLHKLYREMKKDKAQLMVFPRASSTNCGDTGKHWVNTKMAGIHREYMEGTPEMERDICYAIGSCIEACNFLIAKDKTESWPRKLSLERR